jgi:hypothetical protein
MNNNEVIPQELITQYMKMIKTHHLTEGQLENRVTVSAAKQLCVMPQAS